MNPQNGIFLLAEETLGYQTSDDPSNADKRLLVAPSQNMLINYQKKVQTRGGYTRLGSAASGIAYNVKNGWTWNSSSGLQIPQRNSNTSLKAYISTLDGTVVNDWKTITSIFSATKKLRPALWFDSTEGEDTEVMVDGDQNLYEWNGAMAIAASATNSGGTDTIQLRGNNVLLTSFAISYSVTSSPAVTSSYNNLVGTSLNAAIAILGLVTANPGNGDILTLTINGTAVTVQFVTAIGSTAGNVLIGANNVATVANLLGLLQNPGTTNTTQVALTSGNQTLVGYMTTTTSGSITKAGTTTFAKNRFYNTRNMVLRNLRTGTVYAYSGGNAGTNSTTLSGIAGDTTTIMAGDILVQEIVTTPNKPTLSPYTNDVIFGFQNQIAIGSYNSNVAYLSKNTDYKDFTFSAVRTPGQGAQFILDAPISAINALGSALLMFAGLSSIFEIQFEQSTIVVNNASVVTETAKVVKLMTGIRQGALNHECVIPVGNQLAYLTNEVALRVINNPQNLVGLQPTSFSNPIKPDFDAETWDANSFLFWYKNVLFCNTPTTQHQYMLNFIEDADGRIERYWNPPLTFPIGAMSVINSGAGDVLHGHSNAIDETYLLFDGNSDGQYAGMPINMKLPIHCVAAYAYDDTIFVRRRQIKLRSELKNFDEYYIEGEIVPNVIDLLLGLDYDFQGSQLHIERTIDGSNPLILEGLVPQNSLAQSANGGQPLGGLLNIPVNAQKFRIVFEMAKEDYFTLQPTFSSNEIDRYWSIIAQGPNAAISKRKATNIRF